MRKAALFMFAAILILSSVTGVQATPIVSDTMWNWIACPISPCPGVGTAAVDVTAIRPSAWHAPDVVGAEWISSTSNFSSIAGGTIQKFFTNINFGSGQTLTFKVWADDTAQVLIDGNPLSGSTFTNTVGPPCASAAISCTDALFGQFSTTMTGVHELQIRVLQFADFGGTPFGALVEGDLSAVPEPATILLLGSALAAAGVVSRRRSRKSAA